MLNTLIVIKQCLLRLVITNFKKCTKIWERFSNLRNVKFDSEPVYGDNDKHIKTKKSYGDKINTNFQGKKLPKENASCKCLKSYKWRT